MPYKDPEAQREYQRLWVFNRRAAYFKGKACAQCGSTVDLELDHKDGKTKVSHRIWSWSATRLAIELAKCQVLCRICHFVKTGQTNSERISVEHGEGKSGKSGCHCEPCKQRKAMYMRNYNRTQVQLPKHK